MSPLDRPEGEYRSVQHHGTPTSGAIPVFRAFVPMAARARAAEAMARGWIGYGPECRQLEARFIAGRGGWAVATNSCTAALYTAALVIRGVHPRPEVIVPAITFVATAMAFQHAGYRVRVVDVDPQTLMLTAAAVAPLIGPQTAAVVVAHLYGQRSRELPALRRLCDAAGAALIEDCAHRVDLGEPTPPVGDFLCYSFNAVKELPGGDGGLLWGRDLWQEGRARAITNAGLGLDTLQRAATARHGDYLFTGESGLKLRGNDLMASIVNVAADHLAEWRARRREQFARYDAALAELAPRVAPLERADDDSRLMYVARLQGVDRESLRSAVAERGVATSVHYPSLARHPLLHDATTPAVRELDQAIITLPTFLGMTDDTQDTVINALGEALGSTPVRSR